MIRQILWLTRNFHQRFADFDRNSSRISRAVEISKKKTGVNLSFPACYLSASEQGRKVHWLLEIRVERTRDWICLPREYPELCLAVHSVHRIRFLCLLSPGIWSLCHFLSALLSGVLATTFPSGTSAATEIKIRPIGRRWKDPFDRENDSLSSTFFFGSMLPVNRSLWSNDFQSDTDNFLFRTGSFEISMNSRSIYFHSEFFHQPFQLLKK